MIYFAYGSNMDFLRLQERNIKFKFIGKGELQGHRLVFNKKAYKKEKVGYANIEKSKNDIVEGLLFEISNIEELDKFEGYPKHYNKQELEICLNGQKILAMAYVANDNMIKENLKPEKEYLEKILSAKKYLSENYYNFLNRIETL